MKYTDLCAQAEKALEGVTEGEWLYRPNRHDDWGVVKVGDFHLCQIRDPNCYTTDQLNEARANKIDPWEANARFIAFTRAWVPAAAAAIQHLLKANNEIEARLEAYSTSHLHQDKEYLKAKTRAETAEATAGKLQEEVRRLGREVNMARYGQPDFAWSIHKEAMAEMTARAEAAEARVAELTRERDAVVNAAQDVDDFMRTDGAYERSGYGPKLRASLAAIRAGATP